MIDNEPLTMNSGSCRQLTAIAINGFPEFGELSVEDSEYFE